MWFVLFNSWEFAVFFLTVLALYGVTKVKAQNLILLAASYFFYGWWDWRFLSLIALSTVVDFVVARRIHALPTDRARGRKAWLMLSLTTNLGILGFFKYFNFFVESAATLLAAVGMEPNQSTLAIILPVGISFYTFQTLAYTIDVYRGRSAPVRQFSLFALYVCYFPQLVAGPIERPERLVPQLREPRRVTWTGLSSGAFLIFIGLVRKVGIADVVAPEVQKVFSDPAAQTSEALLIGVLLFALQIYGDFSGYSAIARGTSRVLGIELMENFRQPYFSTSVTEFWRRWHISLSTWLRDYLYISLGGNRGSGLLTYRNLMITMLLGGLWHGASWNFVIWGGIHGVALAIDKLLFGRRPAGAGPPDSARALRPALVSAVGWATTMFVVLFAWVFFRADTLADALAFLEGVAAWRGAWSLGAWSLLAWMTAWVLLIDIPMAKSTSQTAMLGWPWPVRGLLYAVFVLLLIVLERSDDATFIYFQF